MSRKSNIGRTINYLFKDDKKLQKGEQKPITIRKNLRTRKLENNIKEFEANETLRKQKRKDAVKLYHTVISFHEKDTKHLTEKVLKDITKEYMKLRGDNIYLATVHYDKESHVHIHCVESGTGYLTGKASRLSKQQFKELKVSLQTYQKEKYPELKNSIVRHERKNKTNQKEAVVNSRETNKQALLNLLSQAESKAKNTSGFLSVIRQSGHEPYYRNGQLTGIKYDGETKFRFSRLGYDKAKLEALNQRTVLESKAETSEQQQLEELETLRSNHTSSRNLEGESRTRNLDEEVNENENDEQDNTDMEHDDDYSR